MRYFYEFKEKDGCRVAGSNLENIIVDSKSYDTVRKVVKNNGL